MPSINPRVWLRDWLLKPTRKEAALRAEGCAAAGKIWSQLAASVLSGMNFGAPQGNPPHDSDCAIHNAPAYPVGPCDCGAQGVPNAD